MNIVEITPIVQKLLKNLAPKLTVADINGLVGLNDPVIETRIKKAILLAYLMGAHDALAKPTDQSYANLLSDEKQTLLRDIESFACLGHHLDMYT